MRNRWRWVIAAIVVLGGVAEYLGVSAAMGRGITSLASQPGVSTAFRSADSGRTDALTTLIAFAILTPIAAGLVAVALVLLVKALEAVVVSCRLPAWVSAPTVGVAAVAAVYASMPSWAPASLHALGLVARAYLVYAYGDVPVIR